MLNTNLDIIRQGFTQESVNNKSDFWIETNFGKDEKKLEFPSTYFSLISKVHMTALIGRKSM